MKENKLYISTFSFISFYQRNIKKLYHKTFIHLVLFIATDLPNTFCVNTTRLF